MQVATEKDTFHYFETYGEYSESLNRGGLSTPGGRMCQWSTFGVIIISY